MADKQIGEAWHLASLVLFNKAQSEGYDNLGEYPGIVEQEVGIWKLELHTGDDLIDDLPPFHVRLSFNGWPAGIIAAGGGIMAAGEAGNEDALIAALENALT